MPVTTTAKETLLKVLNDADPNKIADALAQADIGTMFTPTQFDTGTITASATVTLPGQGALLIQSARVVTSGTATSVGSYLISDAAAVMIIPPGGASVAVGVGRLSADGKTVTFPNTITRATIVYIPKPAADLAGDFKRS